jgi:hypothetical protein
MAWGVVPQVAPTLAGITCFRWDINIRESTVLGLVGAGGIGVKLEAALGTLAWPKVTMLLITILATVVVSEWVTAKVRSLVRVERLVDAAQVLQQRRLQLAACLRVVGAPRRLGVEHHDAQRLAQVGAGDDAGLDRLVHHQLVLDRRRRDVLALAGLEQVLHAAGDVQQALRIDAPLSPVRSQPSAVKLSRVCSGIW